MQLLKKILLVILLLVFLIGLGGYFYLNHLKPSYEGSLSLDGLAKETTVYFDDYGIPHIEAESQEDAMTALGYIHAQDRLWQMELLRRIAPGRLSEIFGKDMLPNDRFFASLGIEEASVSSLEKLDKKGPIFNLANAYLYGVNQFIKNGPTPIEFTLIGVDKEPYDLVDIYNILGYMSFSFAMAQKTDPLLSVLHEKLGATYLADLAIHVNPNTTLIKNYKNETESLVELANAADAVMASMPIPPFIGSNSWVISDEKTRSGKVLFANDPHIQYSQPSVWYEAHISCPDYEMYGYHIAGVPFPLLGHNRQYAYGLTMLENDDIDFYLEELHPENKNLYKTPQGFIEFESSNKTIHVKDAEPEIITIRSTRHGPIMNDVIEAITTENPIAMSWIYTAFNVEILDALFTISRATSMADVRKGASQIHAPGLNVMYGDSEGNVAWWAAGKLYKHRDHVNTKLVLNGSSDADDPVAYLDFNENPMAENPPWKYVYSANNQPDSIAGMLYPGYYLPEDRAKRIVELLESSDNWDQNAVESMINDVTSSRQWITIPFRRKNSVLLIYFKCGTVPIQLTMWHPQSIINGYICI
jgi:penicillin amidase